MCSYVRRRPDICGTGNISNATTQSLPKTTMTTNDDDNWTEEAGVAQRLRCYVVNTGGLFDRGRPDVQMDGRQRLK